jgi:shikimate kinase / 3-dehydroquinate synthase
VNIFLYGPPGVGKSTVGRILAGRLQREFVDLDDLIVQRTGRTIGAWFCDGEAAFRAVEATVCREVAGPGNRVVALGAGALLDPATRAEITRDNLVVCLRAELATLVSRLGDGGARPLVATADVPSALGALLVSRAALYDSFPEQIETAARTAGAVVSAIEARLRPRTLAIPRLRQNVVVGYGLLEQLQPMLVEHGVNGPVVLVTDSHVADALRPRLLAAWPTIVLTPGEGSKRMGEIERLASRFLASGLDRQGTVVALGGGVVGDIAGFAAATFMRGVAWVNVPTSLLAMVDASIGGKTGVDLPEGKNLLGAFHAPALVVADPLALGTLPRQEFAAGMAEVIKHALIGDPALFEALERNGRFGSIDDLTAAIDVKRRIVEADPFERGEREALNAGHTIGHALEVVSGYTMRHGEAIAIGLVAEARMAEDLGLAAPGLAARIEAVIRRFELPVSAGDVDPEALRRATTSDKKRANGAVRFVLPAAIGRVVRGVRAEPAMVYKSCASIVA